MSLTIVKLLSVTSTGGDRRKGTQSKKTESCLNIFEAKINPKAQNGFSFSILVTVLGYNNELRLSPCNNETFYLERKY